MDFCSIPVAGALCDTADATSFVTDPGGAIGDWMAKSAGELAAAAVDLVAKAIDTTTKVDLNAGWFRENYELILPIGLVMLVATFCAQLVRAAVRRDGHALTQAFTGTAAGVLFAFSAIALTTIAVEVVDALSEGLFRAAHSSVAEAVRRIVKVSQIAGTTNLGWMVTTLTGLGAAIGTFLFWCVMMVRKVGILVLVTLAVFAGAGGGWEVARKWRKGWIEATATLIVSKLLMTIVFLLGVSALGKTQPMTGIGALADVLSGIVIMVLVLLCPYATFKFVHWAAEGTSGEDIHRAGGAGAQIARQHAERAARKAASMAATAGTGGAAAGAGAGAAPQGPPTVPGQGPGSSSGQEGGSISPAGEGLKNAAEQGVQPAPTSATEDTTGQIGGASGPGSGGSTWANATPPQGASPASGANPGSGSATGPASPPPPPPSGS
ncbi:ATP-binding protein [Streptomyces bathyalis]|uniref:ATP-binding protein n=1 Tax=Streptomyces bathyalis TaxID=2710756 RepID=A0A7T1WQQ3_9ACTN|nr:ATP-binding protein [Streptomyces bathyalis]QPP05172.1 ATP-binding protein [Streptomyces bathyalis]